MVIISIFSTLLFFLSIAARAAPPAITKIESFRINFQQDTQTTFNVLTLVTTFDQPIYYKSPSSLLPTSALSGLMQNTQGSGEPSNSPKSLSIGYGTSAIVCGDGFNPSRFDTFLKIQNPEGVLMTAPASSDPAASFIMSIGGYAMNETLLPNVHASMIIVGMNNKINVDVNILSQKCNLVLYSPSTISPVVQSSQTQSQAYVISNAAGEVFPSTISTAIPKPIPPVCDYNALKDVRNIFSLYVDSSLGLSNADSIESFTYLFSSLTARMSFAACSQLVKNMYTVGANTIQMQTPENFCPYRQEDAEFSKDPCCNWELQAFQCCVRRNMTVTVPYIQSINSTTINSRCANPSRISAILSDIQDRENQAAAAPPIDPRASFTKLTSFYEACQKSVFQQSCTSDVQCYSGKCDSNSNTCRVMWGDESSALIACYLDQMPQEVKVELKALWNMTPTYPDADSEKAAFVKAFQDNLFADDCVGPMSQNYRSRTEYIKRSDGIWDSVKKAGNQTGCLSEKRCTYRPWENKVESACLSTVPVSGDSFCGQCFGMDCNDFTIMPSCNFFGINTQQECQQANGIWSNNQNMGGSRCSLAGALSVTACMAGSRCAASGKNECGQNECFKSISQSACNALNTGQGPPMYNYDAQAQVCKMMTNSKNSCEAGNSGFTWSFGRFFNDGQYYTQALCDVGRCDSSSIPYGTKVTPEKCAASQYCDKPCGECQGGTTCVDTTKTSSDCSASGGMWNNNVCSLPFTNSTDCKGTFKQCRDLTSKDTCVSGGGLQCFWNDYGSCRTKEICEARGDCNDWEFNRMTCGPTGCSTSGVCFRATTPKNSTCNNAEGWAKGGCIVNSLNSETACTNAGYSWKKKATTAAECQAHGQGCEEPRFWNPTDKTSAECAICGGKMRSKYNWTPGKWKNGTMEKLTWMKKEWLSVNSWKKSLNYDALRDVVNQAVGKVVGRQISNSQRLIWSSKLALLERIACDCTPGASNRPCFSGIQTTRLASCRAAPGVASTCEGLQIGNNTFGTNRSVDITVSLVPSSNFATGNVPIASTSKLNFNALAAITVNGVSSEQYEVVKQNGAIVGQVIVRGKSFEFSSTGSESLTICLDLNPSIPQDTAKYPTADFVKQDGTLLSPPLKATITTSTQVQICGLVKGPGSYVPVIRITNLPAESNTGSSGSTGSQGGGSSDGATVSGTMTATSTAQATSATKTSDGMSYVPAIEMLIFGILSLLLL